MVAAMVKVGADWAIFVSAFSLYGYDASYAMEVQRANPGRFALVKPVGGEFVVKRPSGFEIIPGNAIAMRRNRAAPSRVVASQRVVPVWCHQASGGRGVRCNNPGMPRACA